MIKINYIKEINITKLLLSWTILFSTLFYLQLTTNLINNLNSGTKSELTILIIYIFISSFIIYGNIIYHLTRIGLFIRLKSHQFLKNYDIDTIFFKTDAPGVTFLIPSYKEEVKTIEQTLWSAALQYYPKKRIVLLIDNPPITHSSKDLELLNRTRELVNKIKNSFDIIHDEVINNYKIFENTKNNNFDFNNEINRLNETFIRVKFWFSQNMNNYKIENHVDKFYVENIYEKWFYKITSDSTQLINSSMLRTEQISLIKKQYEKIIKMLTLEITSFERKTYKNLSHEPNKAMNINCYLHLIGKRVRIFKLNEENYIEETLDPGVNTIIPDSKYVITLDADSMLLHDYTIKLVGEMEKTQNKKVAVIQTPYSSYPGAIKPIEVVAGATTDIQYNIHQGFTYYNSTYWVGANAMLRKSAMEDIKMYEIQSNKVAVKYVQDRTVIEDTESSIDLVQKGWRLLNYPERLAYSSTPPDFGSLIIQRERWANGGLIIFPKLIKYILKKPYDLKRWAEFFVRTNYLVSIAGINIGTLLLLIYPLKDDVFTWWLPLASIPYYILYSRDLKQMGYKISEILRVYGLNLILIPINIAGVLKSIEQGITGNKIPFKRTPKIGNRVTAEVKFIIFLYGLFFYTCWAIIWDAYNGHWSHILYTAINSTVLVYSIKTFIGFKESWIDLKTQIKFPFLKIQNIKSSN